MYAPRAPWASRLIVDYFRMCQITIICFVARFAFCVCLIRKLNAQSRGCTCYAEKGNGSSLPKQNIFHISTVWSKMDRDQKGTFCDYFRHHLISVARCFVRDGPRSLGDAQKVRVWSGAIVCVVNFLLNRRFDLVSFCIDVLSRQCCSALYNHAWNRVSIYIHESQLT